MRFPDTQLGELQLLGGVGRFLGGLSGAALAFVLVVSAVYYLRLDTQFGVWLLILPLLLASVACVVLIARPKTYGALLRTRGELGGATSAGRAINERGTVVGSADLPDGSVQAFAFSHGTLAALPLLPDGRHWFAAAVNDRGQVAGSTVADQPHAVLFAP